MRHRITYLRDPSNDEDFDPRQSLKIWKNSMRRSGPVAAKEHRVTLRLAKLPEEVCRVSLDLHSEYPYKLVIRPPLIPHGALRVSTVHSQLHLMYSRLLGSRHERQRIRRLSWPRFYSS